METVFEDLALHYLRPNKIDHAEPVNQCYQLWKRVWQKTFSELDGQDLLFSDDFSRQSELIALFYKNSPIAMVMHRYCDWSLFHLEHDSYFKSWPLSARKQLIQAGSRIVIGSQITIAPEFRKTTSFPLPVKDIIVYASFQHLRNNSHNIDSITGTVRADKGVHKIFYEAGAFCVESNVLFHNVPVDLVAFFPNLKKIKVPLEIESILNKINNNEGAKNEYSRTA